LEFLNMNLNFDEIGPDTTKETIVNNYNLFLVDDHIPDIKQLKSFSGDAKENSLDYLLDYKTVDKLFIFNYYLGFEDFKNNGFFYPSFFIGNIQTYAVTVDPSTLELDWNRKLIAVNCLLNKERIHRHLVSHWLKKHFDWHNQLIYSQSWNTKITTNYFKAKELYLKHIDNVSEFEQLPENWFLFRNQSPNSYEMDDNIKIFNEVLYPQVFSKSIISLVTEPDFWPDACAVTEKYINAVIGLTIPVVTGYKIYEKLSLLGFDIFDDIISTEYQYEKNPTKRVWRMLEENKIVFENAHSIISNSSIKNRIVENRKHLFNIDKIKKLARKNLNTEEAEKQFSPIINDIMNYFRNHNCSW